MDSKPLLPSMWRNFHAKCNAFYLGGFRGMFCMKLPILRNRPTIEHRIPTEELQTMRLRDNGRAILLVCCELCFSFHEPRFCSSRFAECMLALSSSWRPARGNGYRHGDPQTRSDFGGVTRGACATRREELRSGRGSDEMPQHHSELVLLQNK